MDKTNQNAEENFDSQNKEEAVEEETVDESPDEETTEETSEEESESKTGDDAEARRQRRESTIDRLKRELDEKKAKLAEYESTKDEKKSSSKVDDALLARLETRGVLESEDQQYVIKFAKIEGISPVEALTDPLVQDRLNRSKKEREQRESTVSTNNRTGQKSNEVDRWVRKYKRDGSLPDNSPRLTSQILERLKNE